MDAPSSPSSQGRALARSPDVTRSPYNPPPSQLRPPQPHAPFPESYGAPGFGPGAPITVAYGPPRPSPGLSPLPSMPASYGPPRPSPGPQTGHLPPPLAHPVSSVYSPRPSAEPPSGPIPPPPSSAPQKRKRIIVACDGTWLDADGMTEKNIDPPSNVTRICRAIKAQSADRISQVVFYQAGVGTEGGAVSRFVGGATADGLSHNIREAYSFLAHNYEPGDELFLIGFSRGAFTARSIAGLIDGIGLLTKAAVHDLQVIFKDFENRANPNYDSPYPNLPFPNKPPAGNPLYAEELEKRGLTRLHIPIKAVAVWETVGSLGIPRVTFLERLGLQSKGVKEYTFFDTSLNNCIENAFQALALDEQRAAFSPAVWEKKRDNNTNLRQVWFPGVHANVGGGYDDTGISNITLAWMIAQLEPFIDFNPDYMKQQYRQNRDYYQQSGQDPRPWSFGEIYMSLRGFYLFSGRKVRTPGLYNRVNPNTGAPTNKPLRRTCEYIHPSVRARIALEGPGPMDRGIYECPALQDYKLRLTGQTPGQGQPVAVWESKAKRKGTPKRVSAESPLWQTELALLAHSPAVEAHVLEPGAKKRRGG